MLYDSNLGGKKGLEDSQTKGLEERKGWRIIYKN
jgi:hypothetical protein